MATPLRRTSGSSSTSRSTSTSRSAATAHEVAGRPSTPHQLAVVPGRRRAASFAVLLTVLISVVLMGAVFVHTRIAERQLEIDRLERSLRQEQAAFDVLRAERAELRSPTRLAGEAAELGMVPGSESTFVAVDPMLLAITIARTGQVPVGDELVVGSMGGLDPLEQFRLVKSVSSEAP